MYKIVATTDRRFRGREFSTEELEADIILLDEYELEISFRRILPGKATVANSNYIINLKEV